MNSKEKNIAGDNVVAESPRLILRELVPDDAEKLSLVLSDAFSMRFYPSPFTMSEVEHWIKRNIDSYSEYGFGLWAVVLKETGELIGDCGITMQDIAGEMKPEIGYHIRKEYCRKGYASEATKECLNFAFEKKNFDVVYSYMKYNNIPSRRVAEKNGMTFMKYFQKCLNGNEIKEALYVKHKQNSISNV